MPADSDPKQVYLKKMAEISVRIVAVGLFLEQYNFGRGLPYLESAILQLRKIFENIAFAAVAPNKTEYQKFRAESEAPMDYRKDYNGRKIINLLEKVNPDFYPVPLKNSVQTGENEFHFEEKLAGYLTKKKFETVYDRLGKYLHSDNPWGDETFIGNLAKDLPGIISEVKELLERHRVIVRNEGFMGVWIYEAAEGRKPRILVAHANGPFAVGPSGDILAA